MTLKTAFLMGCLSVLVACSNNPADTEVAPTGDDRPQPAASVPSAPSAPSVPSAPISSTGAATGQGDTSVGSDATADNNRTPSTAEECTQSGGTWRRAGMMKLEVCDMPTRDAGKDCRSDSECESVCVARDGADPSGPVIGQCYGSNITVGTCLTLVEGGRISQAQCAD